MNFPKSKDQNSEYFEIELAGGTDEEFDEEFELVDSNEDSVLEKNNDLKFNLKGLFLIVWQIK